MPEHARKLKAFGNYSTDRGISFLEATKVHPDGEVGTYSASIPPDWCFGLAAHGGYLSSLLTSALDQHLEITAKTDHHQVANILSSCAVTYFDYVVPGQVQIKIDQVSTGKHFCQFRASLGQLQQKLNSKDEDDNKDRPSLKVEAIITMNSPTTFTRATLTEPLTPRRRIPLNEIFSRAGAKHSVQQKDSGQSFYRFKPGYECYFNDTPSLNAIEFVNPHPIHGRAVFDVWWKFDELITLQHLGLLVDISGPVLLNFAELKKTHWLRTRQMSFDVVRLPDPTATGWEWVFVRLEVTENVGDRFWQDVTCTDEEGNVICIAKHQCLLQPFGKLRSNRPAKL